VIVVVESELYPWGLGYLRVPHFFLGDDRTGSAPDDASVPVAYDASWNHNQVVARVALHDNSGLKSFALEF